MMRNLFSSFVPCLLLPAACLLLLLVTATSSQAVSCVKIRANLQQQKGLVERRAILKQAIVDCPDDAQINYFYAYNLERLRKYEQALHAYEQTIRLDPKFAKAHFGLGDMYLALDNAGEAILAFKRGLLLAPDNIWAQRSLKQARTLYAAQEQAISGQKETTPIEQVIIETVQEEAAGETVDAVADTGAAVREVPVENKQIAAGSEVVPAEKPENNIHSQERTLNAGQERTVAGQKKPALAEPVIVETVQEETTGETIDAVADTGAAVQETPVENKQIAADSEAVPAEKPENNIQVGDLTRAGVISHMEQAPENTENGLEITSPPLTLPIEFESNSSQLTAESTMILDEVICPALLDEKLAGAVFELAGHTDSYGSFEHNMNISRLRVSAVKQYLIDQCNIDSARLQGVYYGPSRPIVPNRGRDNSKQNRRVEIRRLQ